MGRKILIGITILLISGLLAGWFFFTREAKYFGTSAFQAVPANVAVIVRIHHFGNYTNSSLNNPIWKTYSGFPGISSLYQQLSFADSLLKKNPKSSFLEKDITIIFGGGIDHHWNLSVVELSSLSEKSGVMDFVDHYFSQVGAASENSWVSGAKLTCYSWDKGGRIHHYCITFYRGLLIASADPEIVALAVKRLQSDSGQVDAVFTKANKTATDNVDLNIYLNHKELPIFAKRVFSKSFCDQMKGSSPVAEWSEIDLAQKNNEIVLNGFSFLNDSLNNYLGVFLHQKPDNFRMAKLFPSETSFFMSYIVSDNQQFFRDYEKILDRFHAREDYKSSLGEIKSLYGVDLQKLIIDNLNGSISKVFTQSDPLMPHENKFLVLKVGSGSKMENSMIPLTKLAGMIGKRDLSGNPIPYKIDKKTVCKIFKTPVNDFGKRVFGEAFSDILTNYFTIYDNCLIMGPSYESLGQFIRANVLRQTLGNEQSYLEFNAGLSNRLNLYLWSSPGKSLPFFKKALNSELYQNLENQIEGISKIQSIGWQIGIENGMIYNLARFKYNPQLPESRTSVLWKSNLGNLVIGKPQFVVNPSDKVLQEIIVQDIDNNLYLISNEGRILWKVKLSSPIKSEVFQLDYFRNGKVQYFFNTVEALHLIDHDGNYFDHFPLALKSAATNPVSVVDYDRKGDYRFFIACKDHKVYLFDKKGVIVTGWSPAKTEHDVVQPVQFFRVKNKDYIVYADKNKAYILDRKGKIRVAIKGDISYSRNPFTLDAGYEKRTARLVTTDARGVIVAVGFDGSVKRYTVGVFSPEHYFIYDDFDSDKKRDYIFLDGDSLVVYNQSANQIFAKKFNNKLNTPPELFAFSDKSRKIGITDSTENRIYLINPDGSICKGFPLEGNSRIAINISGYKNNQFNLVTGLSNGYLYNYLIK